MPNDKEFLITYVKIIEHRDKSVTVDGPYQGHSTHSIETAKAWIRNLIDSSSHAIVPKIVECETGAHMDAMNSVRPYFDRLKENVLEANEVIQQEQNRRRNKNKKKKK